MRQIRARFATVYHRCGKSTRYFPALFLAWPKEKLLQRTDTERSCDSVFVPISFRADVELSKPLRKVEARRRGWTDCTRRVLGKAEDCCSEGEPSTRGAPSSAQPAIIHMMKSQRGTKREREWKERALEFNACEERSFRSRERESLKERKCGIYEERLFAWNFLIYGPWLQVICCCCLNPPLLLLLLLLR